MTEDDPVARLVRVLVAENAALAARDTAAVNALLAEKVAAAEALRASRPMKVGAAAVAALRAAMDENTGRLALAIEVQGRILEMVGHAARQAMPSAAYGRRGAAMAGSGPLALVVRA